MILHTLYVAYIKFQRPLEKQRDIMYKYGIPSVNARGQEEGIV